MKTDEDVYVTVNKTQLFARLEEEQRKLRNINGFQKGNLYLLTAGRESGISLARSFFTEYMVSKD